MKKLLKKTLDDNKSTKIIQPAMSYTFKDNGKRTVVGIVRGNRDSRANLMPIYGDLYQIKLSGKTNENHLVTHLGFTSGRHYDVIKIAYIVSVQFKRYVHCSIWGSGLSCILCAHFSRNTPNLILGGK